MTPIRWGERESWSEGYSLQTILGFRLQRHRSQTNVLPAAARYFCVAVTIEMVALSCVSWGRRQVSPGPHGPWVVVVAAGGPCHHHPHSAGAVLGLATGTTPSPISEKATSRACSWCCSSKWSGFSFSADFSNDELDGCDNPRWAQSSCLCLLQWSSLTSLKLCLLLS